MNKRLLMVLLVAALISGGASYLFYRMLAGGSDKSAQTQKVLVATKALKLGMVVHEEDVRPSDWSGPLPAGSFQDPKLVLGRGILATIMPGEPLIDARLAAKGAGGGLAATIPPGKRAVAIRVNDVTSLAGFVVPGMKVDVLVSAKPPGDILNDEMQRTVGSGSIIRTVLQNVEVLSAGTNIEPNTEGKPISVTVINLLVSPEDAEILSLSSNEGRIQLVLRNPMDEKIVSTPGTAMAKLLLPDSFIKRPPANPQPRRTPSPRPAKATVRWQPSIRVEPQVKPPPPYTVEVIHGSKKADTSFEKVPGGSN